LSALGDLFTSVANLLTGGKSLVVGPVTLTPAQLAAGIDSMTGNLVALSAAFKSGDYTAMENLAVEDALGIAASAPMNAIEGPFALPIDVANFVLPWLITEGGKHLNDYSAIGPLVPNTLSPNQNTDNGWSTTLGNQQ
jgi:hypothetical protein